MNLKDFCTEVNININYTNVCDLRSTIFNTHTLNLNDDLIQERINLLCKLDELFGTNIEDQKY